MRKLLMNIIGSFAILAFLAACATHEPPKATRMQQARQSFKPGDILESKSGNVISFDTLVDEVSRVQVVYVGEVHTNMEDHRIQLDLLKRLHANNPSVALAMEMFPRNDQVFLDEYAKGRISETAFLRQAGWERVWGYPFLFYRPIMEFARNQHLKIIGLNAPPQIVRKVARTGLSSLSTKQRGQLATDFHLDDSRHREYVLREFEQHLTGSIKDFDTFFEAQLAWEETMAETLARELSSPASKSQILVMIGAGHISEGVGVPELTARRVNYSYKTIVPIPVDQFDDENDLKIADFIWITQPFKPFHHGQLGIMVHPLKSGEGLEVMGVLPDSRAATAGFKKGDVVFEIDGKRIRNVEELHEGMSQNVINHTLGIKRGSEAIFITIPH